MQSARRLSRGSRADYFVPIAAGLALAIVTAVLSATSLGTYAIVVGLAAVAGAVVLYAPEGCLPLLFGYFVLLGGARRAVADVTGSYPSFDPMLIVPPLCLLVLLGLAIRRGAFRDRTALSTCVLVLTCLALVGLLNPLAGSVKSRIGGLFYDTLPLLWFWVGRGLVTDGVLAKIFRVFAALAVVVTIDGLLQSFGVFSGFDWAWIERVRTSYVALSVYGTVRPLATFASAVEYATFLSVIVAFLVAEFLVVQGARRLRIAALGLVVLAALFLASSREAAILAVGTSAVIVAAWRNARPARVALYGCVALLILVAVATVLGGGGTSAKPTGQSALVAHQAAGLSDPFNPGSSTLLGHVSQAMTGVAQVARNPIGYGTGYVHAKAGSFGGSAGSSGTTSGLPGGASSDFAVSAVRSAEVDPGNAAIEWGIAGLITYVVLLVVTLRRGYTYARSERTWLSLAALGVIVASLPNWLSPMYAVVPLFWVTVGWLDRKTGAQASTSLVEKRAQAALANTAM